jgi:hypothetical protein
MFSLINRLVGVVDDPADTDRMCQRLQDIGVAGEDIEVLVGQEGARRLDSTGGGGWRQRIVRVTQYLIADQSTEYVMQDAALRDGRAVIAVLIRERSLKEPAIEVLREEGAHLISFFGRIQTEEISRWRGEELVRPQFVPERVDPDA